MAEGKKALKAMRDDVQDERVKEGEQIHRGEVLEEGIGHSIEAFFSHFGSRYAGGVDEEGRKGHRFRQLQLVQVGLQPFSMLSLMLFESKISGRSATTSWSGAVSTRCSPAEAQLPFFRSFRSLDLRIGLIIMVNGMTIGLQAQANVKIPLGCNSRCKCDIPDVVCFPRPGASHKPLKPLAFLEVESKLLSVGLRPGLISWSGSSSSCTAWSCRFASMSSGYRS